MAHPPMGRDLLQKSSSRRKVALKESGRQLTAGGPKAAPLSMAQTGTWKGFSSHLLGGRPGELGAAQGM